MDEEPAATTTVQDVTGTRIAAALIDFVLLGVLFIIMAILFGDSNSRDNANGFSISLTGAPFILYILIVLGYYFVMESQTGKTVGKMIMGLRVVPVEGELTAQKVLIRTVLRIVDALPFFYVAGFIVMVTSARKQRIGDMAAGTMVIKA
jgi:uncharacterized RDD family membrane protein YckC